MPEVWCRGPIRRTQMKQPQKSRQGFFTSWGNRKQNRFYSGQNFCFLTLGAVSCQRKSAESRVCSSFSRNTVWANRLNTRVCPVLEVFYLSENND
jgi:hypothetical protein